MTRAGEPSFEDIAVGDVISMPVGETMEVEIEVTTVDEGIISGRRLDEKGGYIAFSIEKTRRLWNLRRIEPS